MESALRLALTSYHSNSPTSPMKGKTVAHLERMTVDLKIQDLDSFKDLVKALGAWAEETAHKPRKTEAEAALFEAAVALADSTSQKKSN